MLFLLEVEVDTMPAGVAVPDFLDRTVKEWQYFLRLQGKGKILAGGKLAGRRGAVAILQVADAAEADSLANKLPLFPFFTSIKLTPLVAPEQALNETQRMAKFLRFADKHM